MSNPNHESRVSSVAFVCKGDVDGYLVDKKEGKCDLLRSINGTVLFLAELEKNDIKIEWDGGGEHQQ